MLGAIDPPADPAESTHAHRRPAAAGSRPRMVALVRWLAIFALAGWIVEPFKTLLLAPVGLAFARLRLMPGAVLTEALPMLLPGAGRRAAACR